MVTVSKVWSETMRTPSRAASALTARTCPWTLGGYKPLRIATLVMPRLRASCTQRIASASGVGMLVKLYAPSPIDVTLHTQVWGMRAAVASGLVT